MTSTLILYVRKHFTAAMDIYQYKIESVSQDNLIGVIRNNEDRVKMRTTYEKRRQ